MTTSDPEQPFGGTEYPPLEDAAHAAGSVSAGRLSADTALPPPVYPPPYPGAAGYPGISGLRPAITRRLRPVPADEAARHERQGDRGAGHFRWWDCFVCGLPSIVALILGVIGDARDQTHRPGRLRDRIDRGDHRRTRRRRLGALPAAVDRHLRQRLRSGRRRTSAPSVGGRNGSAVRVHAGGAALGRDHQRHLAAGLVDHLVAEHHRAARAARASRCATRRRRGSARRGRSPPGAG